jgi:uncharacterized protein YdaU (DUF1376 family)
MGKDPAFLFYSSDFLTGTMTMTNEQVGIYIRLLCLQHQHGRLTEKDMLYICGTYDKDVFDKFKKDEQGMYYNNRLEEETEKRSKFCESRRLSRQVGVEKAKNKKSIPIISDVRQSYVKRMENENENVNIDDNREYNAKPSKKQKDVFIKAQSLSMTKEEYDKLVETYGKEIVDSKIEYADNWTKLKNYKSLYKTLLNWLRKEFPDGKQEQTNTKGGMKIC